MRINAAVRHLGALSQETRLTLFQLLVEAGSSGLTPGALADALNVPPSTLSFHLKDLAQAGLIRSRRVGRRIFYVCDYGEMRSLIEFLLVECCRADPRLVGPYVLQSPAAAS